MKLFAIGLASLMSISSSQAVVYTLSGDMDVFQATSNPGNVGSGTGSITGSYDDVTNLLDYTITFANLSGPPTAMHFHIGAPGVGGGVAQNIGAGSSPRVGSGVPVSGANEVSLLAGNWYVNVHTSAFPGGEVRGQVNVAPVPEPSSALLLVGGLGALALRRRRA